MEIKRIYIGGWFQRTTLHFSEVWDFLKYKRSFAGIDQAEIEKACDALDIKELSREGGLLEYINVVAKSGITYRFYEDGLMIFEMDPSRDIKKDAKTIESYFNNKFSKAIQLVFSKGAPVPKELANILNIFPYIIISEGYDRATADKLFKDFGEDIQSELVSGKIAVYRSDGLIMVNNAKDDRKIRDIVEAQIFFREFKTQLHRYLAMHRIIWDKTEKIKERVRIKGREVDALMGELWSYQKTVNLIEARINQMGVYLKTRQKIAGLENLDPKIVELFQFRFEALADSHDYIKYLWAMTKNYLESAINVFADLQNKSTKEALFSLQLVTVVNVLGILANTYLLRQKFPIWIFSGGFLYVAAFIILAVLINWGIALIVRNKKYSISRLGDIYREIK